MSIFSFSLLAVIFAYYKGFHLPYTEAKWFVLYLISPLFVFFLIKERKIPNFQKHWLWILGFLILMFANLFLLSDEYFLVPMVDRLLFTLLLLSSWVAFSKKTIDWNHFRMPILIGVVIVSIYGLYQLIHGVETPSYLFQQLIGSSFGYANNAAQFLAISLCYVLITQRAEKIKWKKIFSWGAIGVGFIYFIFLENRSIYLGCFLAALAYLFTSRPQIYHLYKKYIFIFMGAIILVGSLLLTQTTFLEKNYFSSKSALGTWRLDVWHQTIRMIQGNPLGIGPERFEFGFIPYHRQGTTLSEASLAVSPHNEFLRFLAEDGVILSLLLFFFVGLFVWSWFKKSSEEKVFIIPLITLFFSEMCFQFPFASPFAFTFAAIFGGGLLHQIEPNAMKPPKIVTFVFLLLAIVFLYFAAQICISRIGENSNDYSWLEKSCDIMPTNWRACLKKARFEAKDKKLAKARETVEKVLLLEPNNFAATRHLSLIAFQQQNRLEGCFLLWKYDDIFSARSTLHEALEKNCPQKWIQYFNRKRPKAYHERQNILPK